MKKYDRAITIESSDLIGWISTVSRNDEVKTRVSVTRIYPDD
jgi:hypothetical protein